MSLTIRVNERLAKQKYEFFSNFGPKFEKNSYFGFARRSGSLMVSDATSNLVARWPARRSTAVKSRSPFDAGRAPR